MTSRRRERILVTGGAGFLGSALVRQLVADGYAVRILDDMSRGSAYRLEGLDDIEIVSGDVRDPAVVHEACRDIDIVSHLAAINGTRHFYERPWEVLEVGILGTLNVLSAAEQAGVRRIQLFSSSEIYQQPTRIPSPEDERAIIPDVQNPRFSYAGSKLAGELMLINFCRSRPIEWQIIRPHNIYGPDMGNEHVIPNFVTRLYEAGATHPGAYVETVEISGTGSESRAFCYVSDAIEGTMRALELGEWGQIYHLGDDQETTIMDLLAVVAETMEVRFGRVEGGPMAEGGTDRRCPDISRLRALGYEPRVSLREGLKLTVPWYVQAARASAGEPAHVEWGQDSTRDHPSLVPAG